MKLICFLLCISFLGLDTNAQSLHTKGRDITESYAEAYSTSLKGGYKLLVTRDNEVDRLYLKKQNRIISQLSVGSAGLPFKNLGYLGADYQNYFVLVNSFGAGNPHQIGLIRKSTGKNIFKREAWWIGAVERNETLLYSENDVPSAKNKMVLYYLKSGKRLFFDFPQDVLDEPQILNRIKIADLTNNTLVIEYEAHANTHRKTYRL